MLLTVWVYTTRKRELMFQAKENKTCGILDTYEALDSRYSIVCSALQRVISSSVNVNKADIRGWPLQAELLSRLFACFLSVGHARLQLYSGSAFHLYNFLVSDHQPQPHAFVAKFLSTRLFEVLVKTTALTNQAHC